MAIMTSEKISSHLPEPASPQGNGSTRRHQGSPGRAYHNGRNSPTSVMKPPNDGRNSPTSVMKFPSHQSPTNRYHHRRGRRTYRAPASYEELYVVAMDCEMVGVGPQGCQSALARVTIVNWNNAVIYDRFVRPDRAVTDYRTFVSGVTEADLFQNPHAIDFRSCRREVLRILEGKILVGHALANDLDALGIRHCWSMTRDTAKYEPFMKTRFNDGVLWPRKLRDLCRERLGQAIQVPGQPHSAYEDAVGALNLYKSVQARWEGVVAHQIHHHAAQQRHWEQQRQRQRHFLPAVPPLTA